MAVFFLTILGAYLAFGAVFAVPFVLKGVNKIDSRAAKSSWGFRLIILPGVVGLWPLLLMRCGRARASRLKNKCPQKSR